MRYRCLRNVLSRMQRVAGYSQVRGPQDQYPKTSCISGSKRARRLGATSWQFIEGINQP